MAQADRGGRDAFAGDTGDAALLFTQPHDREQAIKWYYGPSNAPPKIASLTVSRQTGALNFNTYANWYEGLLQNKQAYAALMNKPVKGDSTAHISEDRDRGGDW